MGSVFLLSNFFARLKESKYNCMGVGGNEALHRCNKSGHTRFQYASSNEISPHSYNTAGKQMLPMGKSSHQESILGSGVSQVPHVRFLDHVKERTQGLVGGNYK